MKIHTFSQGDTVENIAEKYGISVDGLLSSNIMGAENPAIGEELLVLTPTRTYVLKQGDTPEILQRRVMEQAEWIILPKAIDMIANGRLEVINGKVWTK